MIQVVFNLQHYNDLLYLPAALLVETDAQGRLGYMQQRATAATIVPYGIEMTPELSALFDRDRNADAQISGIEIQTSQGQICRCSATTAVRSRHKTFR
jgi:hypothetical protein